LISPKAIKEHQKKVSTSHVKKRNLLQVSKSTDLFMNNFINQPKSHMTLPSNKSNFGAHTIVKNNRDIL
jgi:hypothetical protein